MSESLRSEKHSTRGGSISAPRKLLKRVVVHPTMLRRDLARVFVRIGRRLLYYIDARSGNGPISRGLAIR